MGMHTVGVIYEGTVHCNSCASKKWSYKMNTKLINESVVERLLSMNSGVQDYDGNPPQPIYSVSPLMCVDKEFRPIYIRCVDCGAVLK
jgi:hypothetical protein